MTMLSWAEREVELACKREREYSQTPKEEWDYGCACYESALKAYKSLMEDGHSGMSIILTKQILIRLIEGKPITPIDDIPDIWDIVHHKNGEIQYQCNRMYSLFKYVLEDGTIKYKDIDRYYCVDINNPSLSYHNGFIGKIIDDMFPITMPYCPEEPYKIFCEDFLTDPKNGDYDTKGVFYVIKPDGTEITINRFFKESDTGFVEIGPYEYAERKRVANELKGEKRVETN